MTGGCLIAPATVRPVYRLLRHTTFDVSDFRSAYEIGKPPRRIEKQAHALHMGLSMWQSFEAAASLARKLPILGTRAIAELDLRSVAALQVALTNHAGHWTVWGRPESFESAIQGILPFDDEDLVSTRHRRLH